MEQVINLIDSMSIWDRYKIYSHYLSVMLGLKYSFEIINKERFLLKDMSKENELLNWSHGLGKPDKELSFIAFYYLWKNVHILSFDQFCSKENIRIIDNGDNWKESGFAQKITRDIFGIYEWYYKFKEKIY